jgi:hypothetical protein
VALLTNVNYHSYFDKTQIKIINRKLTEITIKHHIKFVGYIDDVRFSLDDFTQRMPDYMNAHGFHNIYDPVICFVWKFRLGMVPIPIQTQTILEVVRQRLNFELVRAALPLINRSIPTKDLRTVLLRKMA